MAIKKQSDYRSVDGSSNKVPTTKEASAEPSGLRRSHRENAWGKQPHSFSKTLTNKLDDPKLQTKFIPIETPSPLKRSGRNQEGTSNLSNKQDSSPLKKPISRQGLLNIPVEKSKEVSPKSQIKDPAESFGMKRKRMDSRSYKALFIQEDRSAISTGKVDADSRAGNADTPSVQRRGACQITQCEILNNAEVLKGKEETDRQSEFSTSDADAQIKKVSSNALNDGQPNICLACNIDGKLLCCSGKDCNRSYHPLCLDPPLNEIPPGDWLCPSCMKKKVELGVHSVNQEVESLLDVRDIEVPGSDGLQKQYFVSEYWVPVSISTVQLEQYCAVLLANSITLTSCSKNDPVGVMTDVIISTHKCCDHPYLVDPSLQGLLMKERSPAEYLDVGINASGKLQLLDTVLPEIRDKGQRVLILFQYISGSGRDIIGDILEDYLSQRFGQDSYERVDGGLSQQRKQAAVNRFNDKNSNRFVFLLEIRACQSSIKLSAVDGIILFDSDLNPSLDLKALNRMFVDSSLKQIKIFRLYSPFTLEEKVLILAAQNVTLDNRLHNIDRSTSHQLLKWGASYLFKNLDLFHDADTSCSDISMEPSILKDVTHEFLGLLSSPDVHMDTSLIVKVKHSEGTYSKNIQLLGERELQTAKAESQLFWANLLDGRSPKWKYPSGLLQRNRKRVNYSDEPIEASKGELDVRKKRKKTTNIPTSPSSELGRNETEPIEKGNSTDLQPVSVTQSSKGEASEMQQSFHLLLTSNLAKVSEVLQLPDDVKIMAGEFLDYIIDNHRISREPESIFQAFQISLCWNAASLVKNKICKDQSLAMVKKHLNFSCTEAEANYAYLKMRNLRKSFLEHINSLNEPKYSKDVVSRTDDCPIGLPLEEREACHMQALNVQNAETEILSPRLKQLYVELLQNFLKQCSDKGVKRQFEKIRKNFEKHLARLLVKQQEEIHDLKKETEQKSEEINAEYRLRVAVIRNIHGKISVRSDKLIKIEEEDLSRRMEEYQQQKEICFKELEVKHVGERSVEMKKAIDKFEKLESLSPADFPGDLALHSLETAAVDEHVLPIGSVSCAKEQNGETCSTSDEPKSVCSEPKTCVDGQSNVQPVNGTVGFTMKLRGNSDIDIFPGVLNREFEQQPHCSSADTTGNLERPNLPLQQQAPDKGLSSSEKVYETLEMERLQQESLAGSTVVADSCHVFGRNDQNCNEASGVLIQPNMDIHSSSELMTTSVQVEGSVVRHQQTTQTPIIHQPVNMLGLVTVQNQPSEHVAVGEHVVLYIGSESASCAKVQNDNTCSTSDEPKSNEPTCVDDQSNIQPVNGAVGFTMKPRGNSDIDVFPGVLNRELEQQPHCCSVDTTDNLERPNLPLQQFPDKGLSSSAKVSGTSEMENLQKESLVGSTVAADSCNAFGQNDQNCNEEIENTDIGSPQQVLIAGSHAGADSCNNDASLHRVSDDAETITASDNAILPPASVIASSNEASGFSIQPNMDICSSSQFMTTPVQIEGSILRYQETTQIPIVHQPVNMLGLPTGQNQLSMHEPSSAELLHQQDEGIRGEPPEPRDARGLRSIPSGNTFPLRQGTQLPMLTAQSITSAWPNHLFHSDILHIEQERLSKKIEDIKKSVNDERAVLESKRVKELEEVNQKYDAKINEVETASASNLKELEMSRHKVLKNKHLCDAFLFKWVDLQNGLSANSNMQQFTRSLGRLSTDDSVSIPVLTNCEISTAPPLLTHNVLQPLISNMPPQAPPQVVSLPNHMINLQVVGHRRAAAPHLHFRPSYPPAPYSRPVRADVSGSPPSRCQNSPLTTVGSVASTDNRLGPAGFPAANPITSSGFTSGRPINPASFASARPMSLASFAFSRPSINPPGFVSARPSIIPPGFASPRPVTSAGFSSAHPVTPLSQREFEVAVQAMNGIPPVVAPEVVCLSDDGDDE